MANHHQKEDAGTQTEIAAPGEPSVTTSAGPFAETGADVVVPGERKVSVIVPAYNDAIDLEKTLKRLVAIRDREYTNMEIVVAVRPSSDETDAIARRYADVITPGGKVNEARNAGARAASGEVFVFLDADSIPNFGVIPKIAEVVTRQTVGTCSATPSSKTWKARATVSVQNFMRRTKLIRGMANLFFCHSSLFREQGITYNEDRNLGEFAEHIWRARKKIGAKYVYLNIPDCYQFSTDRYERVGYWRTFRFWVKFFWTVYILKQNPKKLEEEYWNT